MKKLKNCPFCGSDEIAIHPKKYAGSCIEIRGHKFWFVECLPCGARTEEHFDEDSIRNNFKNGKEEAIFSWNLRYTFFNNLKLDILLFLIKKFKKLHEFFNKKYMNP